MKNCFLDFSRGVAERQIRAAVMIYVFLILMLKCDLISMGFTLDTPDESCPGLVAWET